MSFRARLLASGALGGVSGVVLAVGMLAVLAMPARAQAAGAQDQRKAVACLVERFDASGGDLRLKLSFPA